MNLNINECIEKTQQSLRKNHARAMLVYKYIQKDLGHKSYNTDLDYYGDNIIYKSWRHNPTGSGNKKENDIVFLIREMFDKGIIAWYTHEPNGTHTYPDLRIWFWDSKNCNLLMQDRGPRTEEHWQEQEKRDENGHYIHLGDDYVNFEIKTFHMEPAKHKALYTYKDKSGNIWNLKLRNKSISDVDKLMSNMDEMMSHMNTFNLMIGYTYNDFKTPKDKWLVDGILKTVSVDMMPPLYNVDFIKKAGAGNNVFMHGFVQEIINNDVYNGHYDYIKDYYEKFFAAFAK